MATEVSIANAALTLLGEDRIISLDDDVKAAREVKAMFDITRDALLAGWTWSFAKARVQLSAEVAPPVFGYAYSYPLPADCLRLVLVGDIYVGADLTDYRGAPTEEFTIEGRKILTNLGAPLNVRYITRVTDPLQFGANFVKAFGCQLAVDLCEALTQSNSKKDKAEAALSRELKTAIRANAIELPSSKMADDEWILVRL